MNSEECRRMAPKSESSVLCYANHVVSWQSEYQLAELSGEKSW